MTQPQQITVLGATGSMDVKNVREPNGNLSVVYEVHGKDRVQFKFWFRVLIKALHYEQDDGQECYTVEDIHFSKPQYMQNHDAAERWCQKALGRIAG